MGIVQTIKSWPLGMKLAVGWLVAIMLALLIFVTPIGVVVLGLIGTTWAIVQIILHISG